MSSRSQPSPEEIFAMGFDQNDPRPVVNVHKRTTKVNIWMVIGVLVFLAVGAVAVWIYTQRHGAT
jgi:hypothetical protein